jgi:hypothetical protein
MTTIVTTNIADHILMEEGCYRVVETDLESCFLLEEWPRLYRYAGTTVFKGGKFEYSLFTKKSDRTSLAQAHRRFFSSGLLDESKLAVLPLASVSFGQTYRGWGFKVTFERMSLPTYAILSFATQDSAELLEALRSRLPALAH